MIQAQGANLNAAADGCIAPPLISAVICERLDYLETLLKAGADPAQVDVSTRTSAHNMNALHAALRTGDRAMEALIREYGAGDDFGTAVFSCNHKQVVAYLNKQPDLLESAFIRPSFTLLHVAADIGDPELTKIFLEAGIDPRQSDADGHAPLRFAARNSPAIEVMELLLQYGADVNAASKTGITALSAASHSNDSLPAVLWLLQNGAEPNLVPKDLNTPLLRATRLKNTAMVQALLEHGADANHQGKNGETAISIAKKKNAGDILVLLRNS